MQESPKPHVALRTFFRPVAMPAGLAAITPIHFVAEIIERMPYGDTPNLFRGIPTPK
jgi:hypothetical protein